MTKQQMTKFVADNALYLKSPTDDQTDTVLAWMVERKLEITSIKEGEAIFTKSGKGKPVPAIAIEFTAPADPSALDKLTALYPGPASLVGVKMVDPEAELIPGTQLTKADLEVINQENSIGGEPELTREDVIAANTAALDYARHAINVGGPCPTVMSPSEEEEPEF